MKKIVPILLLGFFLINSISALDCQYRVNESYEEFGTWLYDLDGNYFGAPLILRDFGSKYMNLDGCSPVPSFKIYNQYDFPVALSITYTLFHPRINQFYPESERQMSAEVEINPYSEKRIDSTCLDIGTNQILEDSIVYTITGEKELILKKGNRPMQKEICKICPNGKECLNDGVSCEVNNECGFGICNPARKCGEFSGICPEGQILNNEKTICVDSFSTKIKKNLLWFLIVIFVILLGSIYTWKKWEEGKKQREINRALIKYNKKCANKLEYDENSGYIVFKDNHNEYYHRWAYNKFLKNNGKTLKGDEVVHHIDRDKLNCDLYNLIAMEKKDHDVKNNRFNHDNIKDWVSGIKELRKIGYGTKEKPFPEYVQKEIEKGDKI